MKSPLDISTIILPRRCVDSVYTHLRASGEKGVEGVALFAGKTAGHIFSVEHAIVPKQIACHMEDGLLYAVEEDELHGINVWLYQHQLTLIAQIHSHPGKAYHSDTDDRYPIITQLGGISIVVPDFGRDVFDLKKWAVYRLQPSRGWVCLSKTEILNLIKIV